MDRYDEMRTLLCAPYAVQAGGTVLSAAGETLPWQGVKKVCGRLALRWDGRVLTDDRHEERAGAVAQWRKVKDVACRGEIEGALLENGDLVWIRSRPGQLSYGSRQTDWTDVDALFITLDPYDERRSYADYAVGLRADGSARVACLGGGEDRSRDIEALLNSLGGVERVSGDCRAMAADGTVRDFSTRNMGKLSREPIPGYDRTEDGCVLQADGTVRVPEGQYPGAEEWRSILCISGCFLPIETGRHILMALGKDGRVRVAERYGNVPADTSEWKLFNHPDTFNWEREVARSFCIMEGEELDICEESRRRLEKMQALTRDKVYAEAALAEAQAALAGARGIFSRKKRARLEAEIAGLVQRLDEINREVSEFQK